MHPCDCVCVSLLQPRKYSNSSQVTRNSQTFDIYHYAGEYLIFTYIKYMYIFDIYHYAPVESILLLLRGPKFLSSFFYSDVTFFFDVH